MCKNKLYTNMIEDHFTLEPLSRREAWCWLLEHSNLSGEYREISASVRTLAYSWRWHRSKVERFIKTLKDLCVIETDIKRGKTIIAIVTHLNKDAQKDQENAITTSRILKPSTQKSQEVIQRDKKQEDSDMQPLSRQSRDSFALHCETRASHTNQRVFEDKPLKNETNTRHIQDSFNELAKITKEKNQKKKTKILKEKNTLLESTKKENCRQVLVTTEQVTVELVAEFARILELSDQEVAWELCKFKDYWLSRTRKPPINAVAAFRNWLRNSVEFKRKRRVYEQHNKNEATKSSFERFLAGSVRAVAELEKHRLDKEVIWN